jgi:hypothetical protein
MLERMNQERFLGILALLVAYPELDRPAAIEPIIRSKVSTQLLHSRFGCDPEKYVAQLIDCARFSGPNRADIEDSSFRLAMSGS